MIYSAKDARDTVNRTLGVDKLLDALYKVIKAYSEQGYTELMLCDGSNSNIPMLTGMQIRSMFLKPNLLAIISKLKELGYKTEITQREASAFKILIIRW